MKICIAVDMHKTFVGGALQARLLAHALIERGHRVLLVCMDRMETETAPCVKEPETLLARHQLEFEIVPFQERPLMNFFAAAREKYELVHFFGGIIPLSLLTLIKKQEKPIILRPFGLKLDDPGTISQTDRGRRYLENLFKLADSFVGISEPLYQSILSFCSEDPLKAVKLLNAVDTDFFAPLEDPRQKKNLKKELGFSAEVPLVVFVGRFEYHKGADILINCWPIVRKAYPQALLAIIGSVCTICHQTNTCNVYYEKTVPVSQSSRLVTYKFSDLFESQAGIKFLENQENVEKYFQAADLFLFPTRQEGMPNALLEAMSSGLACVTSGIKEITGDIITDDQVGLAIDNEDPQEYARGIIRLLADHKERSAMGGNARHKMVNEFSLNKNLERHLELYGKLINPTGRYHVEK